MLEVSNNIWLVSDTHFHHSNVIKYSNRPFSNVDEMNETLIKNWNDSVKSGDRIYHCGDFSFGDIKSTENILRRLNGEKYLILGNHDRNISKLGHYFIWMKQNHFLTVGQRMYFLSHYAHRVWDKSHYGSVNCFGHSHGSLQVPKGCKQLDVGVDCWNYAPVHIETIDKLMDKVEFIPIDHHGK